MGVVGWGPPDGDGLHDLEDGWFCMDWMARQGVNAAHCGAGEMHGREMEPTIRDGSAIIVDRDRSEPESVGIFMVRLPGGPLVRRLRRRRRGWSMYGDNPLCPVERLPRGTDVVGRVMWSAREHLDDCGPDWSAPLGERQLRENLALTVQLLRGLSLDERDLLLDAARGMPVEDLNRAGLMASRTVLAAVKEPTDWIIPGIFGPPTDPGNAGSLLPG